jgi:FlaA1/EpsC-like NDP-sugar epimerase
MGSITSLHGGSASRGAGEFDLSLLTPDGLHEKLDEHSRQLIGRPTGSRRKHLIAAVLLGDRRPLVRAIRDDVVGAFRLLTLGAWLVLLISRLAGSSRPDVLGVAGVWALALVTVPAARALARLASRRAPGYAQNTVIVGAGEVGQRICHELLEHPEYGANVIGFVDGSPKIRRQDLPDRLGMLGTPDRLPELIDRLGIERVVISFSRERDSELLALVRRLQSTGVRIDLVPRLFELVEPRAALHSVAGLPLIRLRSKD